MNDYLDREDYKTILRGVFKQAIEDYIKLQHPKYRKKAYLQEAFLDAVDMFFDPSYEFSHLIDEDGERMDLTSFIAFIRENDLFDLDRLKDWLVNESIIFWGEKNMDTVKVPTEIPIEGVVYHIHQKDVPTYQVDYESREIFLNLKADMDAQSNFVCAVLEICAYHEGSRYKVSALRDLGKIWFRTLKVNNCFKGVS